MPALSEAQQRHAAHYLQVVQTADTLYKQGNEALVRGLRVFNLNQANIYAGLKWAGLRSKENENAAAICSDFPNVGALLFELLFAPRDRLQWLEYALEAAR